ncbi:putative penicillin-binding [Phaeomoniella chlamydospora]|uniref:Putative penicillin-binding n=1 Tax=Phaeomoniella chlamydospora TaxID=158046 RepID=A0A0G2GBS4_PHACM|nr:putative penicillin-binding [Phaeomoniella chlamydospora]
MASELRAGFHYANIGYLVIQHIIQTITGSWIGDLHERRIWGPLSMKSTFIRLKDALRAVQSKDSILAYGYSWDELEDQILHQPWTDTQLVGGGGIISSVADFAKYLHAMIHQTLPMSKSLQQELIRPRMLQGDDDFFTFPYSTPAMYATGWAVSSYRGHSMISHSGAINGFASRIAYLPDLDWGVVLMGNSDLRGNHAIDALFLRLMDDFTGTPTEVRKDMVPMFDEFDRMIVDYYQNARELLYPGIATPPPVNLSLPLVEYRGMYHNPAYGDIDLAIADPDLRLPVKNSTSEVLHAVLRHTANFTLDFEHVSGDFFVAWVNTEVPMLTASFALPAEFRIDPRGNVVKMGIPTNTVLLERDHKIWFDRKR